jgi:hypothetical protein
LTIKGRHDAEEVAILFRVHHVPCEFMLCPCCECGYIVVEKRFD